MKYSTDLELTDGCNMKALIALLAALLVTRASGYEFPEEWHLWKAQHSRSYESTREELQRHVTWLSNKEYIEQHNKHADLFGYTLRMNQFGDMVK